ncbi:MAG: hypothetical protein IKC13_05975 [Elusimicrobiaceae bacterium]|nr:hypothetical protein [Elusimicrobiaceae bacterium]
MKKLVIMATLLLLTAPVFAGALKLSIWDKAAIAIPGNINHVTGLDLGLGSTAQNLYGVQFDVLYSNTHQNMYGISHALVDMASEVKGVQGGLYARAENVTGVQWGGISITDGQMTGLQWGLYNQAENVTGLQLGLINYAKNIHGLQIGLVNIADNGFLPAMVLLNGRF